MAGDPDKAIGKFQQVRMSGVQVIAHQIDTIMDCDQLLVLSGGRLVEQGPPAELAQRSGGTFARLAQAAVAAAAQHQPIL